MSNPNKQKGTAGESAVRDYARLNGFPLADRRPLNGAKDIGDILLTPGLIVEVKTGHHAKDASHGQVSLWLDETERERVNANADLAILVLQRKGFGTNRVEFWDAWFPNGGALASCDEDQRTFAHPISTTLACALTMLRASGWGNDLEGAHS